MRSAIGGRVGRSISGAVSGVGSVAVGALGIAGSVAAGSALQAQIADSQKAATLANRAGSPALKADLLRESRNVKGFTASETMDAMGEFVGKTGDLTAARGAIQDLSTLALATGTDFGELGAAAGAAFNVIRQQVKEPQEQLKQLSDVMTTLAQQGNMGTVEMKDLVNGLQQLGGASSKFEGGPGRLLKSMGAMAQLAAEKGGAGDSAEAVTSVQRFASDVVEHSKKFEAQGIHVFSDKSKTKLNSPEQIVADMLVKTGGSLPAIGELFGERGARVAAAYATPYVAAERANAALPPAMRKAKGVAGREAVLAEHEHYASATRSRESLEESARLQLDEPASQFKEAVKQFNAAIGAELLPVITRMIPEFVQLIPNITKATRAFAVIGDELISNPVSGIGQLIAAKVALDLAGAGLGVAAKAALEASLNSGLGKALGLAGVTVGTLAAGIELANLVVSALKLEGETAARGAVEGANAVREKAKAELASTGELTPETRAELEKLHETETSTITKGDQALKGAGYLDIGRRAYNQLFGGEGSEDLSQLSRLQETVSNKEYREGAIETTRLLDPEVAKAFKQAVTEAAQDFKKTVQDAKPPLNRGNTPAPPVP